jgi:uncharacterized hydrophobic protein (TIGR00271 family)
MSPLFNKPIFNFNYLHHRQHRTDLKNKITEEIEFSNSYFLLLLGSTIIATLGLLINSSAVVIGAMIMAPLYWPMLGVALGIASGNSKILIKSLKLLVYSIILSLFVSLLTTSLTPLTEVTKEISLRINPTILDLLIALASSVIGVLAVYDPRISSSVIGVALSLSLLPPLATAGVGLSFKSERIISGGLQMFLANMIAIIFVSVITLYLLKIRPHNKQENRHFVLGLIGSLLTLLIFSVILTLYLNQTMRDNSIKSELKQQLSFQLKKLDHNIQVKEIEVAYSSRQDQPIKIQAVAYLPEGLYLTQTHQNNIIEELGRIVPNKIDLELSLINYLQLRQDDHEDVRAVIYDQVYALAQNKLSILLPSANLLQVQINPLTDAEDLYQVDLIILVSEAEEDVLLKLNQIKEEIQVGVEAPIKVEFKLLNAQLNSN